MPSHPAPLSAARRETLAALARCIVPHAFEDARRGETLIALVLQRIASLDARKCRDIGLAISLLGSRLTALAAGLTPRPFERQPASAQLRLLNDLASARLGPLRSAVQALRRLILLIEYATPEAQREVGYRGPYHQRNPEVSWEGALEGVLSDDEPIARAPIPAAAHRPPARAAALSPLTLDGSTLRADVVVIGSGAGGAVAAARLAEAGQDVLILEEGELVSGTELDEQEGPLFQRLYADGGLRTSDDLGLSMVQGRCVGGGTTVNWMVMLRTPDWVLDEWATRHRTEGMSAAELAPVFARIEAETHTRLVPDDAHSPSNRIILDGSQRLGWSAYPAQINAKGCVRAGFCGYGCRYGAKQGTLQSYLPRAQAAGARLVTHAAVERISFVERGGAFPRKRLTVRYAPPGRPARDIAVEAPVVIVAGGAVGTPVLLQRSGLGGGAVGSWLRVHPTTGLIGLYPHEMYPAAGIPLSAVGDEHLRLDQNGYGVWIECPPLHPSLAAIALPGMGEAHRTLIQQFPRMGPLVILTRDGADQDRSNGSVRARRDGSISIQYTLGPRDARHLEEGLVAAARLQFAAGAEQVISGHTRPRYLRDSSEVDRLRGLPLAANDIALFSAHVNGTCRLGTDPALAGTDPHGERFGAPGVFVADGSLLPTALGVNPQETIMALASVVAERIAARRAGG